MDFPSSLLHLIFGCGFPVARQVSSAESPSFTVTSRLVPSSMNFVGAGNRDAYEELALDSPALGEFWLRPLRLGLCCVCVYVWLLVRLQFGCISAGSVQFRSKELVDLVVSFWQIHLHLG